MVVVMDSIATPMASLILLKSPSASLMLLPRVDNASVMPEESPATVGKKTPSMERFVPSRAESRSLYLIWFIWDRASPTSKALSSIEDRTGRTLASKSSYIVPNRATAAVFFAIGSSMLSNAETTWKKASFALSPPAANFAIVSSAFSPKAVKASMVESLPSLARILNSLTASPTLSMENTPASAPLTRLVRNSSADNPRAAYCAEYSLRVSRRSPFWSAPFCAPLAMML